MQKVTPTGLWPGGSHLLKKNVGIASEFKAPEGNVKQVPYRGPTNIRRYSTKFSRLDCTAQTV